MCKSLTVLIAGNRPGNLEILKKSTFICWPRNQELPFTTHSRKWEDKGNFLSFQLTSLFKFMLTSQPCLCARANTPLSQSELSAHFDD